MATWKVLSLNRQPDEAGCPSCGRSLKISTDWKLPLLLKCPTCKAEWCQISWGKKKEQ